MSRSTAEASAATGTCHPPPTRRAAFDHPLRHGADRTTFWATPPRSVSSEALIRAPSNDPDIKLELGGRDMTEFHLILVTDYFDYGTAPPSTGLTGKGRGRDSLVRKDDHPLRICCAVTTAGQILRAWQRAARACRFAIRMSCADPFRENP